jgi:hypothetical protein
VGIAHVLLCIAASCALGEVAPDDAEPDQEAAATIDFCLSSILAERQQLRSGEFVVSGTKSGKYPAKPEYDFSGRVLIYCAFDGKRIRIDNLEPGMVAVPLTKPQQNVPGRIERMYIRTPERSVTWNHKGGRNDIAISGPQSMFGSFLFFDVRGLGLMNWRELTDHRGSKVETTVATIQRGAGAATVDTSDPKYLQLVFLAPLGSGIEELRYWLRPDQAFAPARLEKRTCQRNPPDESWQINERAETVWEQIDGVWLPVKLEMMRTQKDAAENLAWTIRWRSVNQKIDNAQFAWKDFGAPDTVPVVDTSTGQVVVIRSGTKK